LFIYFTYLLAYVKDRTNKQGRGLDRKGHRNVAIVSLIPSTSIINFNILFYFGNVGNVIAWVIKQKF